MADGKTQRSARFLIPICRAAAIVSFLLLVEASVARGWISPLFVSRPSNTIITLWQMLLDASVFRIAGTTIYMVLITFVCGAALGLPLGYLLWHHSLLGRACEPLLAGLFASPLILLYPVFLVAFGRTLNAIMAQALLVGIIPIILGTHHALRQVNSTFIDLGLIFHLSRWQFFRHILLPASAPMIFTGLRLGFVYMLLSVIAMEYVVALGGIGNLISNAYFRLDTDELYAGVFMVIFLSVVFFRVLLHGQRWLRAV